MGRQRKPRNRVRKELLQWSRDTSFDVAMKRSPENLIYSVVSDELLVCVAQEMNGFYSFNTIRQVNGQASNDGIPGINRRDLVMVLHRHHLSLAAKVWRYPMSADEKRRRGVPTREVNLADTTTPYPSRGSGGFELLSVTYTPHPDASDEEDRTSLPSDHRASSGE